jgi:diguanylate cyclase (GGDEF)-like protein/PAS domain S-box-containing protein
MKKITGSGLHGRKHCSRNSGKDTIMNSEDHGENTSPAGNHLRHLVCVMAGSLVFMTCYETVKHLLVPGITIWQSHLVTILFSSLTATFAAAIVLRHYQSISLRLSREISDHRTTDREKERYREELEQLIRQRTHELSDTSRQLAKEVSGRKEVLEALFSSQERFLDFVETISDWVWETDARFTFTFSSPKVTGILGYETTEIIGRTPFDFMPTDEAQGMAAIFDNFAQFRKPFAFLETITLHKDGRTVALETSGAPIFDKEGVFQGYRGISRDITDRKHAEEALRESEATLRGFFNANAVHMSVIELDVDDFIYRMPNKRLADFFGMSIDELSGKRGSDLGISRDFIGYWLEVLRYCQECRETTSFEYEFPHLGQHYWFQASISPVYDSSSARPRFSFAAVDVTERKQAEQEVEQLAYFDTLTGLPNRALLKDRLHQALAQSLREGWLMAILFLDIDRFKWINDTLGHAAGDKLLKAVAERLQSRTRATDTVARLGGDEFVLLLSAVKHEQDISHTAEGIMAVLATPFQLEGQEIFISASIGIAICPADGRDEGSLLRNADTAMYVAKESGRNTFRFFSKEMNLRAVERMSMERNLRKALERNEFFLVYQPQIDTRTRKVFGVEALLRWQCPEAGCISPAKFIPIAEETGLIIPIGEWVLRTACHQAQEWVAAGHGALRMAVNISGCQFKQNNLPQLVRQVLAETGLSPANLELELTESILMENNDGAVAMLRELKNIGVHLAIDDFGTGYSSLTYLKHFPIDRLKIDRLFIMNITTNADDASIADAIIAMARSLRMDVIAEGVETEEQVAYLESRQCHEMQGFLFSRPVPAFAVPLLLDSGFLVQKSAGAVHLMECG